MSPTEDELRAALRTGEGGGLDPDIVIVRARAHGARLHERRIRIASAAAVVAVVAGLGVGGGLILGRQSQSHSSSARTAGSATVGEGAGNANGGASGSTDKSSPTFSVGCPQTLPVQATQQDPNPRAQFFAKPVDRFVVCAYATNGAVVTDAGAPITTTLTGTDAAALANSIEHASRTQLARPCPLYRTDRPTLLLQPTATDGTDLPDVTTTVLQNPCNATITNGDAIRYNWLPTALSTYIAQLAKAVPTPSPQLPTHS